MINRVFFVSRHPDIDHICSYIYFTNKKNTRDFIIARDWDSQTNHYLINELHKKGYIEILKRLDIRNYKFKVLIFCLINKKLFKALLRRILGTKLYSKIEDYSIEILKNNLSSKLYNIAKNCELYLDHRNCNRESDYILDIFKTTSKKIISLPHTLLYVENPIKYNKASVAFEKCFANEIFFYHESHENQIRKYINNDIKKVIIQSYRYYKEWFQFRKVAYKKNTFKINNLVILNRSIRKETVVFLDTPFFGNKKLEIKRKSLLEAIQSKYRLIIVPHPRSNILSTNFKAEIWKGEVAILISKYKKFVGIFTTLSIDLSQAHRLYITCHHLRDEIYRNNYSLIDEKIGATKLASDNESVLKLLDSKVNIKEQENFLKILRLNSY